MAEAQITLKLSPKEFDLLRNAVQLAKEENEEMSSPKNDFTPAQRRDFRAEALKLSDLLMRLQ